MHKSESLIAVRCRISRGGFSSERIFRITVVGGVEHKGAAPVEYFFDEQRTRLPSDPPPRGVTLTGFVAARVIEQTNGTVLVSVPSGEVLRIEKAEIVEHPKGSRTHVPVES